MTYKSRRCPDRHREGLFMKPENNPVLPDRKYSQKTNFNLYGRSFESMPYINYATAPTSEELESSKARHTHIKEWKIVHGLLEGAIE